MLIASLEALRSSNNYYPASDSADRVLGKILSPSSISPWYEKPFLLHLEVPLKSSLTVRNYPIFSRV